MDQDNYDTIFQEDDSFHPPSDILGIDSLSSDNDTSSGAIDYNDATEEDLHTKISPEISALTLDHVN